MNVQIQKKIICYVLTLRNIATISFTWSLDSFFFKLSKLMNENRHGILQVWYFVTQIVLTYCEKVLKFEAEGYLKQFIETVKINFLTFPADF